jgi:hypothetical protein
MIRLNYNDSSLDRTQKSYYRGGGNSPLPSYFSGELRTDAYATSSYTGGWFLFGKMA